MLHIAPLTQEPIIRKLNLVVEVFILCFFYHLFLFMDTGTMNMTAESRFQMGFSMSAMLGAVIILHLTMLMVGVVRQIRYKYLRIMKIRVRDKQKKEYRLNREARKKKIVERRAEKEEQRGRHRERRELWEEEQAKKQVRRLADRARQQTEEAEETKLELEKEQVR